jgi:hypothetical protein
VVIEPELPAELLPRFFLQSDAPRVLDQQQLE